MLKQALPYVSNIERAQKTKRLPLVFTRDEVRLVLKGLSGTHQLIASILYVRTTMIYTHVLNRGGKGVRSPLDE